MCTRSDLTGDLYNREITRSRASSNERRLDGYTREIWRGRVLGKPRRLDTGILLIILQKSIWALILIVAGIILVKVQSQPVTDVIRDWFEPELREDPHDLIANLVLSLVPHLSRKSEITIGIVAMLYAALELFEVYGLWRDWIWVEAIIVFEMAALLPYDIWEFTRHPSIWKIVTVLINIAIVVYLVQRYMRIRRRHAERRQVEAGIWGEAHQKSEPL